MRSRAAEMFLALGIAATVSACGGANDAGGAGETGEVAPPTQTQPVSPDGEAGETGEVAPPTQTQPVSPGGEAGEAGEGGE